MQAELKKMIRLSLEKQDSKKMHCKSGWYTEREMKDTLKMPKLGPQKVHFEQAVAETQKPTKLGDHWVITLSPKARDC